MIDQDTLMALHDRIAQLSGLQKNIILVIDEVENMYDIEDDDLKEDINTIKESLSVLGINIDKLQMNVFNKATEIAQVEDEDE